MSDNPERLPIADVKELIHGVEMRVELNDPSMFDVATLMFVGLPKPADHTKYTLPFVPHNNDHYAIVHVYNPITLQFGGGILFLNEEGIWTDRTPYDHHTIQYFPDWLDSKKERSLEEEEFFRYNTREDLISLVDALPSDELLPNFFNWLDLPMDVKGKFKKDEELCRNFLKLWLLIKSEDHTQDDFSNARLAPLLDDLKDVFLCAFTDTRAYRYDRRLIVSEKRLDSDSSHKGILVLS